ncbi:head-tail joining protein [Stenotrophomonas sp. UBA7606]|uniref:head-tail joining protein n=1 Tax=Stenotrophomonas sp. UBA7606 TaxID=1947559 RepID=UPI0025FEE5C3|nr:hypothetical protein [Stenotrophomonas sp. UBA7606]
MSQKAFLQAFDQAAIGSFMAAGMADSAQYTAPGGVAIACSVMVDRGTQVWGEDGMPVALGEISVAFQRAEVEPVKGGIVVVDGDTYRLTDKLKDDASLARWLVVPNG